MTVTAQDRFKEKYITSSEIMKMLGISRTSLSVARKAGKLPDAIDLNNGQLVVWERDTVLKYVQAWGTVLDSRRTAQTLKTITAGPRGYTEQL